MVLCLLSRGSRGNWTKLNHEETVRGPEIAIFSEKSEILLLPQVALQGREIKPKNANEPIPCHFNYNDEIH